MEQGGREGVYRQKYGYRPVSVTNATRGAAELDCYRATVEGGGIRPGVRPAFLLRS